MGHVDDDGGPQGEVGNGLEVEVRNVEGYNSFKSGTFNFECYDYQRNFMSFS